MNVGKFISIEGQDGAGKTTNLEFICQQLANNNLEYIVTREPGGTELGESIRELLLGKDIAITPTAELLLMFAARTQHIEQIIRPALVEGKWVVCDRFTDATYAYQGGGHGVDLALIARTEQLSISSYAPDLTILLDLDVEIGLERSHARGQQKDRFEAQTHAFKQRVRETYLSRQLADPQRIKLVDASANLTGVKASIKQLLEQFICQGNVK